MDVTIFVLSLLLGIFDLVKGESCYLLYYRCSGYDWCCPNGYVCTGSSLCLSIGAIIGICIGALIGLGFFIFIIYLCCRQKQRTVGTVFNPSNGTTTTVVSQQQSGVQYSQQPMYGQPQPYGLQQNYGYSQPSQPAYPPAPPAYS